MWTESLDQLALMESPARLGLKAKRGRPGLLGRRALREGKADGASKDLKDRWDLLGLRDLPELPDRGVKTVAWALRAPPDPPVLPASQVRAVSVETAALMAQSALRDLPGLVATGAQTGLRDLLALVVQTEQLALRVLQVQPVTAQTAQTE